MGLIKKSARKDFNPQLVDNFFKALHKIGVF
jgi:response regulator RpfG family c-di-GMP phosphodiesterase